MFVIFGWVGFGVGHLLGVWRGWVLLPAGELNLGLSTLGSLVFMVLGDLVSRNGTASERPLSNRNNKV